MSHTDQTLRESAIALPSSNCSTEVELYSSAGLVEDTCMRARTFPLAAVGSIKLFGTSPSSVVPSLLWPSCLDSKLQCTWISPTYPWHVLQLSLPPVTTQPCQRRLPAAPILGRAHTSQESTAWTTKIPGQSWDPREPQEKFILAGSLVWHGQHSIPSLSLCTNRGTHLWHSTLSMLPFHS